MVGTAGTPAPGPPLTLVTVVFEAEVPLLRLQARSMARFVPAGQFRDVIVVDNSRRGLGSREREVLLTEFGPFRAAVRLLRPGQLTAMPAASGWLSQQVLKLAVHEQVGTPHYLVLDAKNMWVRPTAAAEFVAADGRARGALHGYRSHPLRGRLERVLRYLDVDPEPWLDAFPVTHTPVVLSTPTVAALVSDLEARSERTFAAEFVDKDLTEFFLYAGWIIARFGGLDGHLDGTVIRSSTVWPGRRSAADVQRALGEVDELDSPFLAVHRTALARADRAAVAALADFWVARGLFPDARSAAAFVARYRARYAFTMSARKVRRTLAARRSRAAVSPSRTARP